MKKVLFLYTELAQYFLSAARALADTGAAELHVVRWAVNREAPFRFDPDPRIRIYERNEYDLQGLLELAGRIGPDAIVCSGWIDKDYVAVCRKWKSKAVTVLALDNKWQGTARQQLARLVSPFTLGRTFRFAWVPGALQKSYARKLGFPETRIRDGFYTADTDFFHGLYVKNKQARAKHFPHRFIYAGRYYAFKGLGDLWQAFRKLKEEKGGDWELWCLGTGDMEPEQHPDIRHFGFVQPGDMPRFLSEGGVFIMPSRVEPWGVVLQEFAAAGFPLVCSSNVGAAGAFVEDGRNGFVFPAANVEALAAVLEKITQLPDAALLAMGEQSAAKAMTITPQRWAATLLDMIG